MSIGPAVPLSSEDLRNIADRIDTILTVVGTDDLPDDDWRWGLTVGVSIVEFTYGHLKAHGDGWLAFYPLEVTE